MEREEQRLAGEVERVLAYPSYYSYNLDHYSYLRRGIYVEQLKAWMRYFPEEQFLILRSEDLYEDAPAVVGRTLEFLGLPTPAVESYPKHNAGGYEEEMDPAMRRRLVESSSPTTRGSTSTLARTSVGTGSTYESSPLSLPLKVFHLYFAWGSLCLGRDKTAPPSGLISHFALNHKGIRCFFSVRPIPQP